MSTTKVAFPPPPPTSNTLTVKQRNQLLRTTKKLGQVLGSTPHLLDDSHPLGPLHVDLPFATPHEQRRQSLPCRRNSIDSVSTTSSGTLESVYSGSSSASSSRSSSRSPTRSPVDGADTWIPHQRPPLLKLSHSNSLGSSPPRTASVRPTLETIPGSPAFPPPAPATDSMADDISFTINVNRRQSVASFYTDKPAFVIPSESSVKREKMDRLKRKLGSGVPMDLVFPPSPPLPAEVPAPKPSERHVTVHFAPAPTTVRGKVTFETKDGTLCSIVESGDEHGASCKEGFGYPPKAWKSPPHTDPEEVDIDLDAKFRSLAKNLSFRKKPLARKGLEESGLGSSWD